MNVDYLRVSVTDRCNLRCIYCNPLGDHGLRDRAGILDFDEIQRVVRLGAECGIRRVRLTGGEPLMCRNIPDLVGRLAQVVGIEDLSLTTNGVFLGPMAVQLKAAGLKRVNISLDAVDRQCYQRMTGFDLLAQVLDGLHKALEVGLTPVRLNCVVMKDINDDELLEFASLARDYPFQVRFIELMPTVSRELWGRHFLPMAEVHRRLKGLGLAREVIAIDGIEVGDLDYIDIGQPIGHTEVIPVTVKSLMFYGTKLS